jgi:hypothetical protein
MIITRAPRVFPILWTLVAPFIDENTRKKIHIHAGDRPPSIETMQHYIPNIYVPDFLGGSCKVSVFWIFEGMRVHLSVWGVYDSFTV